MRRIAAVLLMGVILAGCAGGDAPVATGSVPTESAVATIEPTAMPTEAVPEEAAFAPIDAEALMTEELKDIIDANRTGMYIHADSETIATMRSYMLEDIDPVTDAALAEEVRRLSEAAGSVEVPQTLTREQIMAELDYLFLLLKYGYAGYGYSGGDASFNAIRAGMDARLAAWPDEIETADYVTKLLAPYLRMLIQDKHFVIGGGGTYRIIGTQMDFYYSEEYFFYKDGEDYRTVIDGETYVLAAADAEAACLVPTLDKDGALAYMPGAQADASNLALYYALNLTHASTGEALSTDGYMRAASYEYALDMAKSESKYRLSEVNGVPVLECRSLTPDATDAMDGFPGTAYSLRKADAAVLDLRGNAGGTQVLAARWMQMLTGKSISVGQPLTTNLVTETSRAFVTNGDAGLRPANDSVWTDILNVPKPEQLPNKTLLFVLTDGFCVSSGELLTSFARRTENVVIVGSPTAGCAQFMNIGWSYLPESGLMIQFGIELDIQKDLSSFENYGYAPDLWVPPGESLERVMAFLGR